MLKALQVTSANLCSSVGLGTEMEAKTAKIGGTREEAGLCERAGLPGQRRPIKATLFSRSQAWGR